MFTRTLCVHVYDHERRKDKGLGFVYSLAQNKDILLGSTSVCMDSLNMCSPAVTPLFFNAITSRLWYLGAAVTNGISVKAWPLDVKKVILMLL